MLLVGGYRTAPVIKVTKFDRAQSNASGINVVQNSEQLFARGMQNYDNGVAGFDFHRQIVADSVRF